jgi:hypothetical protein
LIYYLFYGFMLLHTSIPDINEGRYLYEVRFKKQ